jgi:polysaccharide export outer membrane protein
MTFELSLVLKTTVLLGVALIAVRVASRARASRRHLVLASAFAALAALPIAATLAPTIGVPLPVTVAPAFAEAAAHTLGVVPAATAPIAADRATPFLAPQGPEASGATGRSWPSATTIVRGLWALGTAGFLIVFARSLMAAGRLRRSGVPWIAGQSTAGAVAVEAGIHRPVVVMLHEQVAVPATIGFVRPVILLPPDARHWPDADLRRALVHEIEHVRRGDWWGHLVARTVCCAYWFHPLVWVAWRQLGTEAERACDDAVVSGMDRADYADQLVTLAERLSTPNAQPMLSMANRSDLSVRVDAILNPRQRRGRPGLLAAATIVVIVAVSGGTVASLRAARSGPSENSALRTLEVERTIDARSVITGWDPPFRRTLPPVTTATAPNAARQRQAATPVQEPPPQISVQVSTPAITATALDDYVIGPDDVLAITFWRQPEMSREVVVRPDGKISLPLLNEVVAAGLTIEQLREQVAARAKFFIEAPQVTIVAQAINSRKVFIVGEVGKQGPLPLTGPMTVMQLISTAGGLSNFAKRDRIFVLRAVAGSAVILPFNYTAFISGQNPEQNIPLQPGDTVVVP